MKTFETQSAKEIRFRFATSEDYLQIERLLNDCGLPSELLLGHLNDFLVAVHDSELLACVGLEIYGKQALLRSLAVLNGFRNQGLGRELCEQILAHAKTRHVQQVFLLTETASAFFQKLGFWKTNRESAPAEIQATAEFRTICPSTAICMTAELNR
jgi:N-acetylglutamate synthase-like GNAT family acetyltransferase